MDYCGSKETARRWGISERRVTTLCREGRILGAMRIGRTWAIPTNAAKPKDPRHTQSDAYTQERTSTQQRTCIQEPTCTQQPTHAQVPLEKRSQTSQNLRVGAVLVATAPFDQPESISPFFEINGLSLIRRIIIYLKQAGVQTIVVVTGYHAWDIEHHLAGFGLIFLENKAYASCDKFASARIGFAFLQATCDKIFFMSLRFPLVLPSTLEHMLALPADLVIPRHNNKSGHPLLLDTKVLPRLLAYSGEDGMRGAMRQSGIEKTYLQVSDEWVVSSSYQNLSEELLYRHDQSLMRPFVELSLEHHERFFDERSKLLLFLIGELHSLQDACKQMAIARSTGWELIHRMETELGVQLVVSRRGGRSDNRSGLTAAGAAFLQLFDELESSIKTEAVQKFESLYESWKQAFARKDNLPHSTS